MKIKKNMSGLNKLPQPGKGCIPNDLDEQAKDAFIFRVGTAYKLSKKKKPNLPNTDLKNFPDGLGTYSKGLLQANGIPNNKSFKQFLKACGVVQGVPAGIADFEHNAIQLGGTWKEGRLNGPLGAFMLQQVGGDSATFSMQGPAPALDSNEYAIELVELYWASLLRDVPFSQYAGNATAQAAAKELSKLAKAYPGAYAGPLKNGKVTPELLFRGGFLGETEGPYLSQFCMIPTSLGRISIDAKIQTYMPGKDFMTDIKEWNRIQNGQEPSETAEFDPICRYMRNGRDTAAYTQVDELYQAYFIAYLICKTLKIGENQSSPYKKFKKQKAFSTFGGPDIAATLGAVARSVINAVWYQKWRVHLRHRPEAGGGIVHLLKNKSNKINAKKLSNFNIVLNSAALNLSYMRNNSYLLSQAFPEGSPTHPAYPTGHGAVAGACITVLKFFMDGDAIIEHPVVPSADGLTLDAYSPDKPLTVNGELHKLAHNISFGHGLHAGIHWRSDTDASIRFGEDVAIRYLEDQMYSYRENFDIKITKLDGTTHHCFKNH
jgi:hypothetical protein